MSRNDYIGEFEELMLYTIQTLGTNAYGVTIFFQLEEVAKRSVSYGTIYVTLDRLEEKGFVKTRIGEGTAKRGGKPIRYYTVSGAGQSILSEVEARRNALKSLIPKPI